MTRTAATKKTKTSAKKAPTSKAAALLNSKRKLKATFDQQLLELSNSVLQSLELLDFFMKRHLLNAEPYLFREILRVVHKTLPKGPQKTKVRGVLGKKYNL